MTQSLQPADCTFCQKFGLGVGAEWFDEELWGDEYFALVPGVGAFSPGYLLLVTRIHLPSFAALPSSLWPRVDSITHNVRAAISDHFGTTIMFEHGSGARQASGACIDHAHWHILSAPETFVRGLVSRLGLERMQMSELEALAGTGYLMLQDHDDVLYAGAVTEIAAQYVRRELAGALGVADTWDYAAFPRWEMIRTTVTTLRGSPFFSVI